MAKLILETVENIQYLNEEDASGKKNMFIVGPFLQAEIVNKNGRFYPMSIMEREVIRYTKEKIERGNAGGELNHPSSATLNLDRIALKVQSLTREGNDYIGKAKLCGPLGNMAKGLIEDGFSLGVSSRGIGSLMDDKKGYKRVAEDFRLMVAADIVSDPSAPSAFVQGIMENVEFHWDEDQGWMEQVVRDSRKAIDKLSREDRETKGLELFEQYLLKLSK